MLQTEQALFDVAPGKRGFPPVEIYRGLKLVIFDVDGVLTDGRLVLDAQGVESKFFDVRDGTGATLLQYAGLQLGLVSGRSSPVVSLRAREMKIPAELVRQGAKEKLPVFLELLRQTGFSPEEVAYAGDDLIDLPVLEQVGIACCPNDAHPAVQALAHVRAVQAGGRGAARAICEHLLKQRADGAWETALARYLRRT